MVSTIGENKKCSKPPTRLYIYIYILKYYIYIIIYYNYIYSVKASAHFQCQTAPWAARKKHKKLLLTQKVDCARKNPRYHARYVRFLAPRKFEIHHPIRFLSISGFPPWTIHHFPVFKTLCCPLMRPQNVFLALPTSTHLSSKKYGLLWK